MAARMGESSGLPTLEEISEEIEELGRRVSEGDPTLTREEVERYHYLVVMQTSVVAAESSGTSYEHLGENMEEYARILQRMDEDTDRDGS